MLQTDRQSLRLLLASTFGREPRLSAFEMEATTTDILAETRAILSETLFLWNKRHSTLRFQPEILGLCFSFLPLKGRITASHVSQAWRAAAVNNPSLWTELRYSTHGPFTSPELMRLSISRAGALPVHLQFDAFLGTRFEAVLKDCAHCIASVKVQDYADISVLEQPFPRLRKLALMSASGLEITDTFLANTIGSLEILRAHELRLLTPSLALSTLTRVFVTTCTVSSLQRLLASCPALGALTVAKLTPGPIAPVFRTPETLLCLTLGTCSPDVRMGGVYDACNSSPNLMYVHLRIMTPAGDSIVTPALQGAIDLDMTVALAGVWQDSVTLVVQLTGGRRRTISLLGFIRQYRRDAGGRSYPPVFKQDMACFSKLRTLGIPIEVLATLATDAPVFPMLDTLRIKICAEVHVDQDAEEPPQAGQQLGHSFPWYLLRTLADIKVEKVALDIACAGALTEQDAEAMMMHLAPVSAHLNVTVRGFGYGVATAPADLRITFV
ncbi:hypothetical protein AURDEDRAFT_176948 [Auricularia subglabra TFB-10046 SS5]|uniref:Uncharacterized protein n=1 Tax=Auricularia subglabra (strain TFB-10046 / SS5) TaxID=717982 RepID=J0D5G1_AURST|nr:hypothetical protein AURDEDRAFT_176948 [Auricularia subglabra TFB-10046 SS5]